MDFRIMVEPQQGATYDEVLAVAQATEALGFDGLFRSDHYLRMDGADGLPGPSDAWTMLAGLSRETSRIRLGTLVSSVTYRVPGILAIQVAQVDQMSGGRVELGLGTGWFEAEHRAYGIPFPAKRFDLLEEQLAVITGLWETPLGERFSFTGEHYTLEDSPALPKPTQSRIPVIIGGAGPARTPSLAARYATEFNIPFRPVDSVGAVFATVRTACEAIERDPDDLIYSVAYTVTTGATDADVARRAAAIGEKLAGPRADNLAGTAAQVVDRLSELREIGADRVYLQVLDLADLDQLDFLAREIVPQLD